MGLRSRYGGLGWEGFGGEKRGERKEIGARSAQNDARKRGRGAGGAGRALGGRERAKRASKSLNLFDPSRSTPDNLKLGFTQNVTKSYDIAA